MGFPFDSQGPGSSCNVLLHFLYNKSNWRRKPDLLSAVFIRTCGKNDVLGSNVKHLVGVLDG